MKLVAQARVPYFHDGAKPGEIAKISPWNAIWNTTCGSMTDYIRILLLVQEIITPLEKGLGHIINLGGKNLWV